MFIYIHPKCGITLNPKIVLAMGWTTVFTIVAGTLAIPNNVFAQGGNLTMIINCADVAPNHLPQNPPPPANPDAPGDGATLNYAVITSGQITSSGVIQDGQRGWNPDGQTWVFFVTNIDANPNSVVTINVIDPTNWPVCVLNGMVEPQAPAGVAPRLSNMTTTPNATSQ
jgi:hypothetical protein